MYGLHTTFIFFVALCTLGIGFLTFSKKGFKFGSREGHIYSNVYKNMNWFPIIKLWSNFGKSHINKIKI